MCFFFKYFLPNRRQSGQLHYRLQKTALRAVGRTDIYWQCPTLIGFNAPSYSDNLFFCVSHGHGHTLLPQCEKQPRSINIIDSAREYKNKIDEKL